MGGKKIELYGLGCPGQACDSNALSRSCSYCSFISARVLPVGIWEGWNCQAHAEQAQPRKFLASTHTISRCPAGVLRLDAVPTTSPFFDSVCSTGACRWQ